MADDVGDTGTTQAAIPVGEPSSERDTAGQAQDAPPAPPPVETPAAEASPPPPENPEPIPEPEAAPVQEIEIEPAPEPASDTTSQEQNSDVVSQTPPQPSSAPTQTTVPDNFPARGLAARRARQEAKLQKIIELARKQESITNDDVEKLLHVSNATATRYLNILVKEGKLQQIGDKHHARYALVK